MRLHVERSPQANSTWLLVSGFVLTLRSLPSFKGGLRQVKRGVRTHHIYNIGEIKRSPYNYPLFILAKNGNEMKSRQRFDNEADVSLNYVKKESRYEA